MKRTTLAASFAALLACGLLISGMVGCGATNHLQSVTLGVALINGQAPSGQSGFFTLQGNGGTMQLQVTANNSNGQSVDVTNHATYTVVVDPANNQDAFGNTLVPPCLTGTCPNPTSAPPYASGTVEYGPTGLLTAVEPATCTWVDIAPITTPGTTPTPAWFYSGDYVVTATYGGMISQPVYIPIASSAGNQYYPLSEEGNPNYENNPDGLCGPSTGS